MGSAFIIEPEPAWEGIEALLVGAVEPAVSPLAEHRLDEAFGLAVGLRTVRPGDNVASRQGGGRLREVAGVGVGKGPVGDDLLDADAVGSEEGSSFQENTSRLLSMCSSLLILGITAIPCWTSHRSATCATLNCRRFAISCSTGSSRTFPRASGEWAISTTSRSRIR